MTYVTLNEAKGQLSIDQGLTIDNDRITLLIGAAEDWAENYTRRSLAELMELDSPADDATVAVPDASDSPRCWPDAFPRPSYLDLPYGEWSPENYRHYWAHMPSGRNDARPLRRDVKAAILLKIEMLYDRNADNLELLQTTAENMLDPYRQGLGV